MLTCDLFQISNILSTNSKPLQASGGEAEISPSPSSEATPSQLSLTPSQCHIDSSRGAGITGGSRSNSNLVVTVRCVTTRG